MSTATKIDARRRAREAKAKADAERVKQDKKIEDAAAEFYIAVDKLDELRAQIAAAEAAMNGHVETLFDLGESAARVADLTGLSVTEVRAIQRRQQTQKKEPEQQEA